MDGLPVALADGKVTPMVKDRAVRLFLLAGLLERARGNAGDRLMPIVVGSI